MKKALVLIASVSAMLIAGCSTASPNAGYEGVLVEKPIVFGHGGIDPNPVSTGLTFIALSTDVVYVSKQPIQAELDLKDVMSSDGVPLEFDATIRVQVLDSVDLIKRFGPDWYKQNIEREFYNLIRQEVRQHGMNETAIQPTAIETIDAKVYAGLTQYLKEKNIPVALLSVTVGKANPPDSIKNQRIATATQQQRIITEGQTKLAEDARKAAEESRAAADNGYRNAMGLSPEQFLELSAINMQQKVCSEGAKCVFIANGAKTIPILDMK